MTFEPDRLGESKADLAAALQQLRKDAGLSQVRLARRSNMSQTKLSHIENGRSAPSLLDVELLLRALAAAAHVVSELTALARSPSDRIS
ncbi:helix-turn-helix transcriptional regulator [Streptomyces sp. JJ66]|uniref:helix-turn-helix transcriptional regulator n=1 Tax=Streptomyces sp. JJ66 TaxID=2803843 RepID=UPI001C578682|nr:helix-turn-helix transcriptional regulator [Streptomyces sp. JJ66]MBW1602720.1 helix-turn-helix transcriptional regulator [Streptomyces sp. JJ66]